MNCDEARNQLSPFLDGQLNPKESATLSKHIDQCAECSRELSDYAALSSLAAQSTMDPPAHLWNRIQEDVEIPEHITEAQREQGFWAHRPRLSRRILIGLTAAIAVGVIAVTFGPDLTHDHDEMTVNFDHYLDAYANDPDQAAEMLFAEYPAQEVDLDEAAIQVGYTPVVANGLPNRYSVVSTNILNMPCCKCVKTICSSAQGQSFVIFEHDAEQPMWFGDRRTSKCDCGGIPATVIEFDSQMAATWRVGNRSATLVGARDMSEVMKIVSSLSSEADRG